MVNPPAGLEGPPDEGQPVDFGSGAARAPAHGAHDGRIRTRVRDGIRRAGRDAAGRAAREAVSAGPIRMRARPMPATRTGNPGTWAAWPLSSVKSGWWDVVAGRRRRLGLGTRSAGGAQQRIFGAAACGHPSCGAPPPSCDSTRGHHRRPTRLLRAGAIPASKTSIVSSDASRRRGIGHSQCRTMGARETTGCSAAGSGLQGLSTARLYPGSRLVRCRERRARSRAE